MYNKVSLLFAALYSFHSEPLLSLMHSAQRTPSRAPLSPPPPPDTSAPPHPLHPFPMAWCAAPCPLPPPTCPFPPCPRYDVAPLPHAPALTLASLPPCLSVTLPSSLCALHTAHRTSHTAHCKPHTRNPRNSLTSGGLKAFTGRFT
jgi:hypothetical protein